MFSFLRPKRDPDQFGIFTPQATYQGLRMRDGDRALVHSTRVVWVRIGKAFDSLKAAEKHIEKNRLVNVRIRPC